ncbi:MAG: hypothetical protein WCT12_21900 [Verrucomicrobiota bacterium]
MKTHWIVALWCGLLASWSGTGPCQAQGIPEPGLLILHRRRTRWN